MGTHACTRIQKSDDFIEMHTRFDGFADIIQSSLVNSPCYWMELTSHLQNQAPLSPSLLKWSQQMRSFVEHNQKEPSIEATAMLLCAQSFGHHHVLPSMSQASQSARDSWRADNPDVVLDLEGMSFSQDTVLGGVEEKPLDDAWRIVRIVSSEDGYCKVGANEAGKHYFTDMKVLSKVSPEEILQWVWQLPLLWLELHAALRQPNHYNPVTDRYEVDRKSLAKVPLLNNFAGYKLKSFYSPSQHFDSLSRQRDPEFKCYGIAEILEEVCAGIPFDLDATSFATHLSLISAGQVLPMTHGEQMWSAKLPAQQLQQITIYPDKGRTNAIFVDGSNFSLQQAWLQSQISTATQRFNWLASELYPAFTYALEPQFMMTEQGSAGMNYEHNMVAYFHLLTSIDHHLSKKA